MSDVAGIDWTFPLNNLGADLTFDDMDFGMRDDFPQIDIPLPVTTAWESHSQKYMDSPQVRNPPLFFNDGSDYPTPQVQPDLIPPKFPPLKKRACDFEWGDHSSTGYQHSEKQIIHRLSQLSIRLYDHIKTIPPQTIYEQPPPAQTGSIAATEEAENEHFESFSLDETFKLTQDLVDIYPVFMDTFLKRRSSQYEARSYHTDSPDSQASSPCEGLVQMNESTYPNRAIYEPVQRDHASILLLLSCHVRLIDVYEELLKHMAACVGDTTHRKPHQHSRCDVPTMKIGQYTAPPSSAIQMQLMLFVHLSAQLAENAADFAAQLRDSRDEKERMGDYMEGSYRDEASMLSLATAEKVKGRASNMFQEMSVARTKVLIMVSTPVIPYMSC